VYRKKAASNGERKMNPQERAQLIDALIEGDISEADFLRIEAELSVDPKVRQQFFQRLQLDLLLQKEAQAVSSQLNRHETVASEAAVGATLDSTPTSRSGISSLWYGLAAIAIAASFAAVVFLIPSNAPTLVVDQSPDHRLTSNVVQTESTATGFALLAGQSNAVWHGKPISTGNLIPAGELHLESGMAHLELFSGVQMVIEGEARFSVDSAMQVTIHQGRASANVPDAAHGFQIKTKQGNVVDLGTEFAIEVGDTSSRVEVVSGEVEVQPLGSESEKLVEGELRELTEGKIKPRNLTESLSIVSPEVFERDNSSRLGNQIQAWKNHGRSLQKDEDLVAFFRISSAQFKSRQIENLAEQSNSPASKGAIVAAERTRNRWGTAESALDFSRLGSRVRVNVPGVYGSLTLSCWAKINSLDKEFNSLFLTDGHELSEPHWQIMQDGRLFFSVKKFNAETRPYNEDGVSRVDSKYDFYSPVFWNPSLSGTWMMITTVYDIESNRVTHYVNGKPIGSEDIPEKYLVKNVKIGPASIGNWSEPMYRTDPEFVVRNFNGSIDEFMIFSKALTADEISNH